MQKNEVRSVVIEKLAGEMGLGHADGMTVFVKNALPGETVEARVEKVQKNCAFLKTLRIENPSPDRLEPPCPVYWQCGGCQTQHMRYALSLEMKREEVESVQSRIGGVHLSVPPVIGMDDPWHYRNKISLPVGPGGTLGYFAPRSHRLIPVENCLIARENTNRLIPQVQRWIRENSIPVYDETTGQGLLRHLMIRENREGKLMAVLVAAAPPPALDALVNALKAFPCLHSLHLNLNSEPGNVILGRKTKVLFGPERMRDTLCGLHFDLSPVSFFQINPVQTEKLYTLAASWAELSGDETVCDLYCGAGTISLLLAKQCKRVIGIEEVAPAVTDARHNAEINGIRNAEFIAAKAEEALPALVQQGLRPDVIVLDPPRKGCEARVLEAIAACAPRRVVYVACDPATQARDLRILTALGYTAVRTQSVDMFCQTKHVETVCLLSKLRTAQHINVDLDLTKLDVTVAEAKAAYAEIQAYVLEHTGLRVSCLYIAQVKAKHGIIERACCNKAKTEGGRVPKCPPEKERAIEEALRHFRMI